MSNQAEPIDEEMLILVDEQDQPVGVEAKMRTHELGLMHRAFSVFIFRQQQDQLEVLLQQRQINKYHCGGLWTNTCCSHPRVGESIVAAGQRRLKEEIGITTALTPIGSFTYRAEFSNGLTEHEFDHVMVGFNAPETIVFNPDEVAACKWVRWNDLLTDLATNPQKYTPWLSGAVQVVEHNLAQINTLLFNSTGRDKLC